jgi:hypothetical protein
MKKKAAMASAGIGAGLMFVLDPDRGKRRRALLRDQAIHLAHETGNAVGALERDVPNRTRGVAARVQTRFGKDGEYSDEVLVERVRSTLGRTVSHPGAIEVSANAGRVTLTGPVLTHEQDRLINAVRKVRGVAEIDRRLEPHDEPGNVSALQNGKPRRGERFALRQEHWSPTARLLAGGAGGALATYGLVRRDPLGALLGISGSGLAARAVTNKGVMRLVGAG